MDGWQESHLAHKNHVQLIPEGSFLEQVEEEGLRGKRLTQIYVDNGL